MAFTFSTTALPQESNILRGNVAVVGGYWKTATITTAQAIQTGGTDVLIAGAHPQETALPIAIKLNLDGSDAASAGTLQLIPPGGGTAQGNWWAIVRISGTNPTS